MSCDNCKSGFRWDGTPTGTESKLAGVNAYVAGTSKSAAVLLVHDIFGWTLNNARLLADHYAKEADVTVYLPDFFEGEVIPEDTMSDEKKRAAFDMASFIGRNSKETRWPYIKDAAQELKRNYPKVGAIGFCYGGWAVFRLGADPSLVDAVSTAHPALLEKSEIDSVKVPVQLLVPEFDEAFPPELKEHSFKSLSERKNVFEYIFFPGMIHGFATRGDPTNSLQKDGLERAKRSAVNFFNEFLH